MADAIDWDLSLLTDNLKRLLLSLLDDNGFKQKSTNLEITEAPSGPWSAIIYRIKASNSVKMISWYFKCISPDEFKREWFNSHLFFKNEIVFYEKVHPAFQAFQKEKLSSDLCEPVSLPKCYRTECDGQNDVIVLEDLSVSGYIVLDQRKPVNISEMKLIFRELGRFHGSSLAFKDQRPTQFFDAIQELVEGCFDKCYYYKLTYQVVIRTLEDLVALLKEEFGDDHIYVKKLSNYGLTASEKILEQAKGDASNEPYNVVTHGDPWLGNFMFRYDQEGGGVLDVKFLDFQQARYTSPALDLGRLLFVLMDKAARARHRDELLRCYHDSLSETLRVLGSDPDELFPFCAIESQLKKYSPFFVFMSLFNLIHTVNEAVYDFDGNGLQEMVDSVSQRQITSSCKRRLFEVIQECVARGYL